MGAMRYVLPLSNFHVMDEDNNFAKVIACIFRWTMDVGRWMAIP